MAAFSRKLSLVAARAACWIAPVMVAGFTGVALAHFFFEVGNYPEPRARYAVGALFLFLFAPVTGAIWYFARQRVRALGPAAPSSEVTKR
ncbi:MAG: hypothetical protein IT582_00240 [Opitutaceae bacterium]|nr:hypothetical protein [Opitutaceae bacterium]